MPSSTPARLAGPAVLFALGVTGCGRDPALATCTPSPGVICGLADAAVDHPDNLAWSEDRLRVEPIGAN